MNMYSVTTRTINQIIRDQQGFIMWYNMKSMPHANCKVGILKYDPSDCEEWYIVILKSYNTIVAGFIVDDAIFGVFCTGTYSRTTAKQITNFCREFCTPLDSHWMKKLANTERQVVVVDSENLNYTAMRIISDYVESKDGKGVR